MEVDMRGKYLNSFLTLTIFFNIGILAVSGQEPTIKDILKLPSCPADFVIPYGTDTLQYGELRLPSGPGPHPVAIIIHGGCWLAWSLNMTKYTAPLSDALRNEGIATWNIEYRQVGHPGGGWPGTFNDLAMASDHLRKIAKEYNLDLNRVIVIGHSAGAHLALWVGARHKLSPEIEIYNENPLPINGVVALAAPVDMERSVGLAYEYCGDSVVTKMMGGLPDEVPANYDNASPIRLLPIGVPQRLFVGDKDIPELLEHLSDYANAGIKLHEDIQLDTVKHVVHNELAVPGSIAWLKVRAAILSLLKPEVK